MLTLADRLIVSSDGSTVSAVSGNTSRAQALTQLFARATVSASTSQSDARNQHEYQRAARWSTLSKEEWHVAEKIYHFCDALYIEPDSLHVIDRLAVSLVEAAEVSPTPVLANEFLQARKLLLHYIVLRGIVRYPLQRPLQYIRGLDARGFWPTDATSLEALFSWLPHLVEPGNFAAIKDEVRHWLQLRWQNMDLNVEVTPQIEGVHEGGAWNELHLITAVSSIGNVVWCVCCSLYCEFL